MFPQVVDTFGHLPEKSGHSPEKSGHLPEKSGHSPESWNKNLGLYLFRRSQTRKMTVETANFVNFLGAGLRWALLGFPAVRDSSSCSA